MPAPLPRRKQIDARVALFSSCRRPSHCFRRVGFRINRFEACSAFTRVPACMVAEPPGAALLPECISPFLCLREPPWLLPAGATVAKWVSHPPERSVLARRTEVQLKSPIEPEFGIIRTVLGFGRFSLRGIEAVQGKRNLVGRAWNTKRKHRLINSAGAE